MKLLYKDPAYERSAGEGVYQKSGPKIGLRRGNERGPSPRAYNQKPP